MPKIFEARSGEGMIIFLSLSERIIPIKKPGFVTREKLRDGEFLIACRNVTSLIELCEVGLYGRMLSISSCKISYSEAILGKDCYIRQIELLLIQRGFLLLTSKKNE